jgi:hypothetical protein
MSLTTVTYYRVSSITMIAARMKETHFQKAEGLRSISGARVLLRNALLGCRRS